jgi:hypothetical protein
MLRKLMLLAMLALPLAACNPCHSDTACGSEGLCFQGSCHDFTNDHIPCMCTSATDCKISGLQCAGGKCVTDLNTPVMCGP